ncbi:MAG: hypothetical protein LWX70_14955 [Sphingobacteriia bacterium]|nr:hypothetical protein [Sphingobacteriia bacterium]
MNKYYITLPYSYVKYGQVTFYLCDEEEAERLAYSQDNWANEDYDDSDDSDSNSYNYDSIEVELDEEDVDEAEAVQLSHSDQKLLIPCDFSADLLRL